MVRIIIKGGVWKNTEDEVLKAAIAKYGKNQWARISSLLVRKTPKQCKARWYEWLDPSIKKTEWSKTEDEKLLHLAKLMPTQWRTIAPIVGRTATQCLERYQKLLDDAEAKENEELGLTGPGGEAGPSADDVRRLRPGEIDPNPETKPARPDPIDMDEDEKEMLSEARARLANTQGKKAKRKARERQLEEARRLAVLQKKRELKAAGIIMRSKVKRKGMDYNTDIPFEKKPAPGFYDTSEELAKVTSAPIGQSLRRLENKRKPDDEEAERRKRQRKGGPGKDGGKEAHQTKFIPARDAQIQKLKEADQIGKRRKLMLPPEQVGEAELEEIVKLGQAGEYARSLVSEGNEASDQLLGEYGGGLEAARMARTPRTAPQQDNVMAEARNLRNMTIAQTPLLGEENTPMHAPVGGGTGFEGATPRHQVAFTPNPLATPRYAGGAEAGATPRDFAGATPLRTPLRDSLHINPVEGSSAKRALRQAFSALPKPVNDWEVLVPEEQPDTDPAVDEAQAAEDAAERDAALARIQAEEERRALARRSLVVQRGLPRPAVVDADRLLAELPVAVQEELAAAERLINHEFVQLLQHDAIVYPLPGTSRPGATRSFYEHPDDDDVASARDLVRGELAEALGVPELTGESEIRARIATIGQGPGHKDASWAHIRAGLVFDAQTKRFCDQDAIPAEGRIAGLAELLEREREKMAREADKVAKAEKRLGVQLGGYQARAGTLAKRLTTAFEELQRGKLDLESFSRLSIFESAAGPRRVEALKEEVTNLERKERGLQERYQELTSEKESLQERVSALEESLMADAEALNDAVDVDGATEA